MKEHTPRTSTPHALPTSPTTTPPPGDHATPHVSPAASGVPPMKHLSGPEGLAALATLVRSKALFAFDFDGTLAPIRPRPGDVHVSATIAMRLEKLRQLRPVAIVTG